MLWIGQLVHGTQVLASNLLRLTSGEERDTGNSWWNGSGESSHGEEGNLFCSSFLFSLSTGSDHVWLKQHTLEENSLRDQLVHDSVEHFLGDACALLDIVCTVGQDLWLDNWHEAGMLANLSVSCERVSGLGDANIRWASIIGDLQNGSPFGKSGSHFVVISGSLGETVQTHGDTLVIGTFDDADTRVDLDSSENALVTEKLHERNSGSGALSDGLIIHDDATDKLVEALDGVEQLTPVVSVLLRVLNSDLLKSLAASHVGLVGGQDTFAVRYEKFGIFHELLNVLVALV